MLFLSTLEGLETQIRAVHIGKLLLSDKKVFNGLCFPFGHGRDHGLLQIHLD